jgi:hypothetical protein
LASVTASARERLLRMERQMTFFDELRMQPTKRFGRLLTLPARV